LSTLERAIALAVEAHAGQSDKAGAPYILHPLGVMLAVNGEYERMAAVLHDVVEDCGITLDELRERGFPEAVVEAVEALTKRSDEHGPDGYFDFVERAGRNDIARAVKLADITDNMDLSRIESPTEKDFARVKRYRKARKLLEAMGRERQEKRLAAPTILPLQSDLTVEQVEAACPGSRPIIACDFYIDGAEQGSPQPGGLRLGRIVNVDHHAPIPRMQRRVTSTQLACEYLVAGFDPSAAPAPWVAINHTDCDSILSSALLMGFLAPDERLVAASIAADHTGIPDPIADLLQAIDEGRQGDRTDEQYLESLQSVIALLEGGPLELSVKRALDLRLERREAAKRLVKDDAFERVGPLAWASLENEIDGAFFPGLLPDAALIMLAVRHPEFPDRWVTKLRLGLAAPPAVTLDRLEIRDWDPGFGGRWNAGSNKRGGGTSIEPLDYANRILAKYMALAGGLRG
jgi:hypothetical protein